MNPQHTCNNSSLSCLPLPFLRTIMVTGQGRGTPPPPMCATYICSYAVSTTLKGVMQSADTATKAVPLTAKWLPWPLDGFSMHVQALCTVYQGLPLSREFAICGEKKCSRACKMVFTFIEQTMDRSVEPLTLRGHWTSFLVYTVIIVIQL